MPINPLELQTNFSQMNLVGKQVSSIKEAEDLKENQINNLIQKNSEIESDDIPITKDPEELKKIKDQLSKKNRKNKNNAKKENIKEEVEEEKVEEKKIDETVKNPNIGQRIDIIG